jgi:hypothetical protein
MGFASHSTFRDTLQPHPALCATFPLSGEGKAIGWTKVFISNFFRHARDQATPKRSFSFAQARGGHPT